MEACYECGGRVTSSREVVPFKSLPGVLLGGVEVHRCQECKEFEVVIPNINALEAELVRFLVQKPCKLDPAEIRFLRKSLGWSQEDLAREMMTRHETVSRWENGAQHMKPQSEWMLRVLVLSTSPIREYSVLDVPRSLDLGEASARRSSVDFHYQHPRWEAARSALPC